MMHLRRLVLFTLLLPGTARRGVRDSDSHGDAQQQTDSVTRTLEVSAETQEGGLLPAPAVQGVQRRPQLRAPHGQPLSTPDIRPVVAPPLRAGPRRATVVLNTANGPEDKPIDVDVIDDTRVPDIRRTIADPQAEPDRWSSFGLGMKRRFKNARKRLEKARAERAAPRPEAGGTTAPPEGPGDEGPVAARSGADGDEGPVAARSGAAASPSSTALAPRGGRLRRILAPPTLQQIKTIGLTGVVSYALWEGAFWSVCGILHLLKLASSAIPLRVGLAAATVPWVRQNVVKELASRIRGASVDWDDFAENFTIVDEAGVAVKSLNSGNVLLKLLTEYPFNTGSGIEVDKVYEENESGEPILTSYWSFRLEESDLSDKTVIEELKKLVEFPLDVEGSSTFTLNADGKVEKMEIGLWSVNDDIMPGMASLENFEETSEFVEEKLEQWAKDLAS